MGHLKFRGPGCLVILVSWLIALPEYALQVPANRIGAAQFSPTQLKIIQKSFRQRLRGFRLDLFPRNANLADSPGFFALIVARCFSCNRPEPIHPIGGGLNQGG